MNRIDVFHQMITRRARDAGLPANASCHTFRATGITAYLENGSTLEKAQTIGVSRGVVEQLMRRRPPTGAMAPRPHAGGRQPHCAPDAEVFRASGTQVLGPPLVPGDIGVLDALSAHKAVGVPQALARRGARRLYVPPYAPDLSPMDLCVSTLKSALRAAKARTRDALATAIRAARETVPARDASNGFRHGGYAPSCCENRSSVASPSSPYRYKRAIILAASQISDNPSK
jgi:transposase